MDVQVLSSSLIETNKNAGQYSVRSRKNMRSLPVSGPADVTACHLQPGKDLLRVEEEKWQCTSWLRLSSFSVQKLKILILKNTFAFSQV